MKDVADINRQLIISKLKPVDPKSHKGTFGHALIIGGSYGKIGAVSLASKAALRTGCGLVTAFIPGCGYTIIQTSVPEVMTITDHNEKMISEINFDIQPQAIGIGPGIGQEEVTQNALHKFLKSNEIPLIIDADGLNILAKNPFLIELLRPHAILTPHPKELERLVGIWETETEKLEKVINLSKAHDLVIVVKGAPTYIVVHDVVYRNTTGNPALATAGSGDILTGMITSLVAQGYSPQDAAIIGVYLHGSTADLALPFSGSQAFIASDIIENIGKAYLALSNDL